MTDEDPGYQGWGGIDTLTDTPSVWGGFNNPAHLLFWPHR